MRLLLDTNVLLAGLFTRGVCEALLDGCLGSPRHVCLTCEHILEEFRRHAQGKFGAPAVRVDAAVATLRGLMEVVEPQGVATDACRDPSDLPVLGAALAGRAERLVTGDADLLALGQFQGIGVVSPRAALVLLQEPPR